jgi:hypothetical protein
MKGNSRKGLGAILAGVGMTTLLGVMSGTGIVRATPPDPDVDPQLPPAGWDDAPTEAEVTMKERCVWFVAGVPSSITLTADALEDDTVYDGDKFSLSATLLDYVAWTSGNTTGGDDDAEAHAACTFFGEQTGIAVDGEWSGTAFTAEAQNVDADGNEEDDTLNMGFSADATDPLTLNLTTGTCRAFGTWSVGPNIAAHAALTGSVLTLGADDATERPDDLAGSNDKCNALVSVTASIPEGKTPLYAGKAYKFTGPTLTTDISIDSVRTP